nr:MAG TPA: hypothetical protein [Caudoviricetes sp.]
MLTGAGEDMNRLGQDVKILEGLDKLEVAGMRICVVGITYDLDLICIAYKPECGDFVVGKGFGFDKDAVLPRAYWCNGIYDLTLDEALEEMNDRTVATLWYSKEYRAFRGVV